MINLITMKLLMKDVEKYFLLEYRMQFVQLSNEVMKSVSRFLNILQPQAFS